MKKNNINFSKAIEYTALLFFVASIILFMYLGASFFGVEEGGGLIGLLVGIAVGWMQFILLCGFSELINDVHHIRLKTCGDVAPVPKTSQSVKGIPQLWECPLCHKQNPVGRNVCFHCGTRLDNFVSKASASVIAGNPDGSWMCPFCDTHNTAESKHCKNCGIEK